MGKYDNMSKAELEELLKKIREKLEKASPLSVHSLSIMEQSSIKEQRKQQKKILQDNT